MAKAKTKPTTGRNPQTDQKTQTDQTTQVGPETVAHNVEVNTKRRPYPRSE